MIEALIVILSLILILSRSLKLFFFFCVYFFSLLCFVFVSAGLIWLSVVFYINPEKKESKKKQKKRSSFRGTVWSFKIRQTLSFFLVKKDDF